MIEPENDELVQVSYLCDMDSQIWEDELLNECGDIRSVGMANDKVFMSLGIYPVSINYEKDGTTVRARENSMLEFDWVEDNIYKPNKNGINLLSPFHYCIYLNTYNMQKKICDKKQKKVF